MYIICYFQLRHHIFLDFLLSQSSKNSFIVYNIIKTYHRHNFVRYIIFPSTKINIIWALPRPPLCEIHSSFPPTLAQSAIVDHLHAQCPKLEQGFEAQFAIGESQSSYRSWNRWWRQRIWGKFEAIESVSFCWIFLPLRYGWIFMSLYFLIYLWQVTLLYPVALPILHC